MNQEAASMGEKHTPTPWEVLKSRGSGRNTVIGTKHPDYLDSDGDGADVAYTIENGGNIPISREQAEANAAFIVEACNQHSQLLERCAELEKALGEARRNAYIRGFQRGYDKKAEIVAEGPQEYERVRAWAEAHAISYCDQFEDDAALASQGEGR